jgi:hypothetical protein
MKPNVPDDDYENYCTDCRGVINPNDKICPHCGADTSEFIEEEDNSFDEPDIDEQLNAVNGDYLVIPFIGKIKSGFLTSENAETVSKQLQSLINQYSRQGWEFRNIAKVDIVVTPGCLASLFGAKTSYITFDQVIFRRARP